MARRIAVFLGLIVATALLVAPAGAQQYPPTTQAPQPAPSDRVLGGGQVRPGETRTFDDCEFEPGTRVDVAFNGQPTGFVQAGPSGCAEVAFRVLADECPAVEVNGQRREARLGQNTITLTGPGEQGETRTVRINVTVTCAPAAERGLPRTGMMILRWSAVAAVLIAVGGGLVWADRRRGRSREAVPAGDV